MRWGLGLNKILSTVHAYPTWSEAEQTRGGCLAPKIKPEWALNILQRYLRGVEVRPSEWCVSDRRLRIEG